MILETPFTNVFNTSLEKINDHQQEDFSSLDDEEAWQLMDLSLLDFKGGDLAFKRNLEDHTKTKLQT